MKHIYNILFLITVFNFAGSARASHIIGSEITYKYQYGNTYKITLKVYRDCRECKFNGKGGGDNNTNCNDIPNIIIKGSKGTFYENEELASVSMTRVAIRNLTPTCPAVRGACQSNTTYPVGIEEHVLEADFDFTPLIAANQCRLDLTISIASRNKYINNLGIEQNFYNYSSIDLCNGRHNNSAILTNVPFFILSLNQPFYYSPAVADSDGDSLVFKLQSAKINASQDVMYATGKSYDKPITVFAPSSVINPNQNPPEGLYISSVTGDMVFTPIQTDDKGVFVLEVEEWRKNLGKVYEKIGVVRRDVYVEVGSFNNNSPMFKNTIFDYNVCIGESVCFDIDAKDAAIMGQPWDSVKFGYTSNITGAMFNVRALNNPPYATANFCWIPKPGDVQSLPYTFTVFLTDNACPLRASASRTFTIKVYQRDSSKIKTTLKDCGEIEVENISKQHKDMNSWWEIYSAETNELITAEQGFKKDIKMPKGGVYYIVNKISNLVTGCQNILYDTISVPVFTMPKFDLGPDPIICPGTYTVNPVTLIADNPYIVYYNNGQVTFPYQLQADKTAPYYFTISDKNGCKVTDRITINVYPQLVATLKPISQCANAAAPLKLNDYMDVDWSKVRTIVFTSSNADARLFVNGGYWYFESVSKTPATLPLTCTITDINGCITTYKGTIVLVKPLDIRYNQIRSVCLNENPVNLRIETEIQMDNGTWSIPANPSAIKGDFLDPSAFATLGAGTYDVIYYNDNNGCPVKKTLTVTLLAPPKIIFTAPVEREVCKTASPVTLSASPANGKWYGKGVSGNSFNPGAPGVSVGSVIIHYSVDDKSTKCSSVDSFPLQVNALPQINIISDKAEICEDAVVTLQAYPTQTSDIVWSTSGSGTLNMTDKYTVTYQPVAADAVAGNIMFSVKVPAAGGCPDVVKSIPVKIKALPQGAISVVSPASLCEPATFTFSTNHTDIDKQVWYINGKEAESYDYAFPYQTTLEAGKYMVSARVERAGCISIVQYAGTLEVLASPNAYFITDPSDYISREYPRVRIEDLSDSKVGYTREWTIGKLYYSNEKDFYVTLSSDTDTYTFRLVVINNNGCRDEYSRIVKFAPNAILFIPTAFSPDSKGPDANNQFMVQGADVKDFSIMILSNNGEIIYKGYNMQEGWDGTYLNKPAPAGVYAYKISITDRMGKQRDYAGTVTLLR